MTFAEKMSHLGALKTALKAKAMLFEMAVLPELMNRLKAPENKARQGVFTLKSWQLNQRVEDLSDKL